MRDAIDGLDGGLRDLQAALIDRAEEHAGTVMPGFTHLQTAQPVTFGHHLLAYVEMLGRDRGRLADCRRRLNECPLGAAALAGTSFPIDRDDDRAGARLRPARPRTRSTPSPTATSRSSSWRRGAILAMHLSRFAEEIVLWVSDRFRLRQALRCLHHRQLDHAAKAQSRRGRAGARQDRAA